jgi:hypothetical protein
MSGNSLGDEFAIELENFLETNIYINEIDISCNHISCDKIIDLYNMVMGSNRFYKFNINNNEEVPDEYITKINNHCRRNKLKAEEMDNKMML